ncbi:MAG: nucleotidyltransferase family protein [Candidatus Altiarchaeota archaeon]|nr:nucleotidyltransferase family protein [Candidatus Altiarchaeota archaeon]
MSKDEAIEVLRNELPYPSSTYGVKKIAIFGSLARGTEREDSDIDLLIEFEKPIGLKFIDFADYIEKLLDKKIDLLTPEGVKGIRIKEVAEDIKEGMVYV